MTMSTRTLVAAEWRKATTTKMLWVLVLVGVLYSCMQVVTLTLVASGVLADVPSLGDMLSKPAYITTLLAETGTAATFALVLGIIAMTTEFRHMTITSTFLAAPRRSRVLLAKLLLYGVLGAGMAVVTFAFVLVSAYLALLPFEHAPITMGTVVQVLAGAVIGLALYAVLGVSLGSLITNQVAAIVTALIWVLLVEALVGIAFPSVSAWLPGGALNSAMDVGLRADLTGGLTPADHLPAWGGILVLLGYATVFGLIASRTTLRRDIT
jgi:ABC-type transport system involved in multi-copper enzyme maturation permease subunit